MSWTLDVQFTVNDGAAGVVSVPSQTVMAVIGPAGSGTVGQVVPTRQLTTLTGTFGFGGPLVEASGQVIQAGGTVLAVRATSASPGVLDGIAVIAGGIVSSTNATPIVVTVASTTGMTSGQVVVIAGHTTNTNANGTWRITLIDATTFSLDDSIGNGVGGSTGTITPTGSNATLATASTGAMWFTGTPNGDYWPMAVVVTGFTAGTTGGTVMFSLDAGRNFGPQMAIGTNLTMSLKDTGGLDTGLVWTVTTAKVYTGGGIVNGAVVGDSVRAHAIGPRLNDAGLVVALTALVNYVASSAGVFPMILVSGLDAAASDATAFESGGATNLDSMAAKYLFERGLVSARDVHAPAAWGGQSAENEATWMASVIADYASTDARRVVPCAGWYNMPSAFATAFASSPSYRSPLSWALAAREVAIDTQRHAGKVGGVQGGNIKQIVVSPTTDPYDGFVYHNELLTPGFDYLRPGGTARLTTATTHFRKPGFFFSNPLTLAPQGSDFTLLPQGLVMDVACTIAHGVLSNFIAADFTTKTNGTLSDSAANTIKGAVYDAIQSNMVGVGMISSFSIVVDQTQNIQVTKILQVSISILGVVYILQVNVPIGFTNALAAQAA